MWEQTKVTDLVIGDRVIIGDESGRVVDLAPAAVEGRTFVRVNTGAYAIVRTDGTLLADKEN